MLNVQVRLQKEQENRVKLELQVAELEEQIDKQATELLSAQEEQEQLKIDLAHERESKQVQLPCASSCRINLFSFLYCYHNGPYS